ncbi:MAG TPA: zinc ABC transporter substrate-binding protein [Candidatus Nitrosotenuis sp.]|nr:zinc ABC transporter substrate-binding protein [Candidatus Nitrosotenuis sp.]
MKKSILAVIGSGLVVAAIIIVIAQLPKYVTTDIMPTQDSEKLKVIASFYPLYEFSKNIGQDKAEVATFIPVGIEPHEWEPTSGDIFKLKEADIFVYNGAGFEPFVQQLVDSGEYDDVIFVESTDGITLLQSADGEEGLNYDPHVWLDPILAKHQVTKIKDAMVLADPQNAEYYKKNAELYNKKLDELDFKIRAELSNCNKNTFMPFHSAFTYFANRYGLSIMALSGTAPESEATASEIKEFVDFVKENQITVIFAEDLIDPRLAEVLADEAGVQVMVLSPIEGLTNDELKAGKTYLTKMEENLQNLKVALDCQ